MQNQRELPFFFSKERVGKKFTMIVSLIMVYLDNNVIRIWNDEIMKAGLNATATTLLLQ